MQQNEIGTVVLNTHRKPIIFDYPPLTKGVTYQQLKRLVRDLAAEHNIKTKTTVDLVLKELDKLKKIEEYPICYLKAFCRFQLTDQNGNYPGIPYIDNIPDNTKLTDEQIIELKTKLKNDFPLLDDISLPYTEAQIFEKKRKLIQMIYFQIEQEKYKFRPLDMMVKD